MAKQQAPTVPDLHGTTVLITGGNAGIGKETAVALARAGASVTITARDATKGQAALDEIRTRSGSGDVTVMDLDLASFASVREFASRYADAHASLDVLVNNAGLMLTSRRQTVDGNEMTFQVNHLGPFLLTNLLRDPLVAAGEFLLTNLLRDPLVAAGNARVVNVSSDAHKQGGKTLDFDALQSPGGVNARNSMNVYGRTKLENILFTRELSRRWATDGVTTNAVHPGFVRSGFGRDGDGGKLFDVLMPVIQLIALSAEQGAYTSVYVASSPEVAGVTGKFFVKCKPVAPSAAAQDDAAAARLWDVSAELTGLSTPA
jgi:retinol dehydrogenase 12